MKAFLDTNIIVYSQTEGPKAEIGRELMIQGGLISVQVLNEFTNVLRTKMKLDWMEIGNRIADVITLLPDPLNMNLEDHRRARSIAARYKLHIYDSLIVASALRSGCGQVLTEDMQHGQIIEGVMIVDPFK